MRIDVNKLANNMKIIEFRQNKLLNKVNDLQLDMKFAERSIKRDIHILKDEMETVIHILTVKKTVS